MISITFRLVTFLVISLLNILYAIIWIAGVQVNFAVGTQGNFLAFGGTFQERILQGIYISVALILGQSSLIFQILVHG